LVNVMSTYKDHVLNLPTRADEAWKYTSLRSLGDVDWRYGANVADTVSQLSHDQLRNLAQHCDEAYTNIFLVNGLIEKTLSDDEAQAFVCVKSNYADFSTFKSWSIEQRLLALAALESERIELQIADGAQLEKPVQIVLVGFGHEPKLSQKVISVRVGRRASARFAFKFVSLKDVGADLTWGNYTIQCHIGEEASVQWMSLADEAQNCFHTSRTEFDLAAASKLNFLNVALGAKLARHFVSVNFSAIDSFAGLYGITVAGADQHIDHYTFVDHQVGHNQSVQEYKSLLSGNANSVFRGRVRIAQDAQKASSAQMNKNLLLSRTAQVQSIPQLEIYADDVKAGHGSTVGQLSQDEMFYFLSRGISQVQAARLLSFGFAREIVRKIDDPAMQRTAAAAVTAKLEKLI
jgi:Fe-S cluster assembly protein SufD